MFQHLLVPLDGSPLAEQALPVAARLARASDGTITVLHVISVSSTYGSYGTMQPVIMQDLLDTSLHEANNYLDGLLQRSYLAGVKIKKQVVLGVPALAILSTIDEQTIDLVVISSHGYTGIKRWLLGSVTEKVVHHTPVPILILREGEPLNVLQQPDGAGSVRAIVPLDTSARSQDAITPAATLVAALSAPGQGAIHLTQIVPAPKEGSREQKETLLQNARQNLQAISECIRDGLMTNFGPDLHLTLTWSASLDSDIAEGIVRVAETDGQTATGGKFERCDLIAMTTHGYSGIQRWTMGSIAGRVLHATQLPLLLVRPADMLVKEQNPKKAD